MKEHTSTNYLTKTVVRKSPPNVKDYRGKTRRHVPKNVYTRKGKRRFDYGED